jgi:type I restriction enzyme S subunit
MIEDLKPYPEYKDSGLSWLGEVPVHWPVQRIKTVLQETDRRSQEGTETLLSLTRIRGLIPHREMTEKMYGAKTLVGYKKYRAGQLVMNRMQAWSGMFGAGRVDGLVSPDYAVFNVPGKHSVQFILERIKSPDLVEQFALESKGIGSGFNRLYTDRFGQIAISLPPPSEQAEIARFLAWATNRLDRAIGAKRRIIALLQEQKQAIIHRAVTRGLDPSVPLKDSGIPWLGEIPEHWEVLALKRVLSRLVDCEHKTAPFVQQSNYRVVRTSAVRNGLLRWSGTYCTSAKAYTEWTQRAVPEAGDVIFTREAPAGEACIIPEDARVCLGQRTVLMKPQRGIYDSQFLVHMIYAGPPRQLIELTCQGSTVSHFNMDDIGLMKILAPPLSEQIEIIAKVTELTEAPSLVIDKTEREITLLREYRTRLIADVVTGKLDVREVAAGLPEPQNVKGAQLEPQEEEPEFEAEGIETESMD